MTKRKITTLVTVTEDEIKGMMYLACMNPDDYNLDNQSDPGTIMKDVSSIIETFIERTLEAYL